MALRQKITSILVFQNLVQTKLACLSNYLNNSTSNEIHDNYDESVINELLYFLQTINDFLLEFVTNDGTVNVENLVKTKNIQDLERFKSDELTNANEERMFDEIDLKRNKTNCKSLDENVLIKNQESQFLEESESKRNNINTSVRSNSSKTKAKNYFEDKICAKNLIKKSMSPNKLKNNEDELINYRANAELSDTFFENNGDNLINPELFNKIVNNTGLHEKSFHNSIKNNKSQSLSNGKHIEQSLNISEQSGTEENIKTRNINRIDEIEKVLDANIEHFSLDILINNKVVMEVGRNYKVAVKHIDDLNNFYVLIMDNSTKQLYKYYSVMTDFYKTYRTCAQSIISDIGDLQEKCFLVVYYESVWYRAQIESIETNTNKNEYSIHLVLIDFGKRIVESNLNNCRKLHTMFDFPIILQKVGLNSTYLPEKNDIFKCMVSENTNLYHIKCKIFVNNRFDVLIRDANYRVVINNIIDRVKEACIEKKALKDLDPMEEDFYSSTNDYNINPDDACQAVCGYVSTNSRRLCKFGTKCWRKKCYKLHEDEDLPEGLYENILRTISDASEISDDFVVNQELTLTVTHIIDIGHFYATEDIENKDTEETVETLFEFMNDRENVLKLRKLNMRPYEGQIVIAHFEGNYYRGKIIASETDEDEFDVLFVDFGIIHRIKLKDLRQMQTNYNCLRFQAFDFSIQESLNFSLKDLCSKQEYDQCLQLFKWMFLYNQFEGVICSTNNPWEVKLISKNGNDIVEYYSKCCNRIIAECGGHNIVRDQQSLSQCQDDKQHVIVESEPA